MRADLTRGVERIMLKPVVLAAAILISAVACTGAGARPAPEGELPMAIVLTSSAFQPGAAIPSRYTCDGDDVSPPLAWAGVPAAAASLALLVDDPDAPGGNWVHWIVFNLPPETAQLPENVPAGQDMALLPGAAQGQNSYRHLGYGGPCPPGGTHRYFFHLYALDTTLDLQPGTTRAQLQRAMEGHILDQGELMGTYSRR